MLDKDMRVTYLLIDETLHHGNSFDSACEKSYLSLDEDEKPTGAEIFQ